MGKSFNTGLLTNGIAQDSSNNVGIGGAANASYKLAVTGASLFTGAGTFSSSVTAASGLYNGYTSGLPPTSGSATRGGLRLNNASNIAFDFGTVAAGQAWIQVSDANNYASNFALLLNPNGGNVGIGTSSPACRLDILGTNEVMNISGTNAISAYTGYYYNTSTLVGYIGNGSSILSGAASSDFIFRSEGALVYAAGGNNERMRITSAGDIEFKGGAVRANGGYFRLSNSAGTTAYGYLIPKALWLGTGTDQSPSLAAEGGYGLSFFTNGTTDERMRITSGGQVLVNKTSSLDSSRKIDVDGNYYSSGSGAGYFWENRSNAANHYGWYTSSGTIYLWNGSANAASINPSTGAYTALNPSDIRIKDNVRNYNKGLNELLQINVKEWEYNGKAETFVGEKGVGFIANELEQVIPEWVGEFETFLNAEDEEKTKLKNININELPYMMLKAIQEQQEIINQLSAKVTALENR